MLQSQNVSNIFFFVTLFFILLPLSAEGFVHHGATSRISISSTLLLGSNDETMTSTRSRANTGTSTSALYDPPRSTLSDITSEARLTSAPTTTASTPTRRIHKMTSLHSFCDLIDNAPQDSLVAVKFYGKSCPLCKRVAVKYQKMAKHYATAPIQFSEIEKTVHPTLFDTLQITTFPYLQIYRNGRCIASHATVSESVFERIVSDTVQQFLGMSEPQWESFLTDFAEPIDNATRNYESMRDLRDGENDGPSK